MAITIKNDSVDRMAREASKLEQTSLTEIIRRSLEVRLMKLRIRRTAPDTYQEILELSQRCAALPNLDQRSEEEIMGYDSGGLLPHGH